MKLYRTFATVGGLTMVSRVLGFARDILIAATLGSGAVADAFFVAFRFPNLFRRLFGEGAFNAAFVPTYAATLERSGPVAARLFAGRLVTLLLLVLGLLTAAAILWMPEVVAVLAPGFPGEPEKFALAVTLSIGLASSSEAGGSNEASLLALADSRVYEAKAGGRNRVVAE